MNCSYNAPDAAVGCQLMREGLTQAFAAARIEIPPSGEYVRLPHESPAEQDVRLPIPPEMRREQRAGHLEPGQSSLQIRDRLGVENVSATGGTTVLPTPKKLAERFGRNRPKRVHITYGVRPMPGARENSWNLRKIQTRLRSPTKLARCIYFPFEMVRNPWDWIIRKCDLKISQSP